MPYPLESAYLKLSRAVENLKQADAEAQLFVESNPYMPVIDYNFEPGDHRLRIRVLGDPPAHLGLVAGDAIHNLRSALDHLVYELADLDPATRRGEKTQYPIATTREAFDRLPPGYLHGVPEEYRAMIRQAQPYNPRYELLGPLARLDNRDKHRLVEPLAASAVGASLHPLEAIYDVRVPTNVVYFDDGAVLARFRTSSEVNVQVDLAYSVRFGPRGEVGLDIPGMRILVDRIAEILVSFRVAFD